MPICCPSNGLELKNEVEGHHKGHDGIKRKLFCVDAVGVHSVGECLGNDGAPASIHLLEPRLERGFVPCQ